MLPVPVVHVVGPVTVPPTMVQDATGVAATPPVVGTLALSSEPVLSMYNPYGWPFEVVVVSTNWSV
jgi:hypothetical protein